MGSLDDLTRRMKQELIRLGQEGELRNQERALFGPMEDEMHEPDEKAMKKQRAEMATDAWKRDHPSQWRALYITLGVVIALAIGFGVFIAGVLIVKLAVLIIEFVW